MILEFAVLYRIWARNAMEQQHGVALDSHGRGGERALVAVRVKRPADTLPCLKHSKNLVRRQTGSFVPCVRNASLRLR